MGASSFKVLVALIVWLTRLIGVQATSEQCALFPMPQDQVHLNHQPSYIEIGTVSVGADFSLSMMVKSSAMQTNGNLFALGSQTTFPYYSASDSFLSMKFLVLEVTDESVRLTIKRSGSRYLEYLEVSHVYPNPYELYDGSFHQIEVRRTSSRWCLRVDEGIDSKPISEFDIRLQNKPAFVGGRPESTLYQFKGVIKAVTVNGEEVDFSGLVMMGPVRITRCSRNNSRYALFMKQLWSDLYVHELLVNSALHDASSWRPPPPRQRPPFNTMWGWEDIENNAGNGYIAGGIIPGTGV